MTIFACATSQLKIKSTMGNFYKKINTKEFLKRGTHKLNIEEPEKVISASLFKAPQTVQVGIDLSQVDRILYVKLIERDLLNIERHLLLGKEYLYLNEKGKLYVLIDLPIIYFLKGRINFYLDILALNSKGRFTKYYRKKIVFNWKPIEKAKDKSGFIYGDLTKSTRLIDHSTIHDFALKEIKNASVERFHPEYSKELNDFINKTKP
jgi:hypothetical protein